MITFFRVLVILFIFIALSVTVTHEFTKPFYRFVAVSGLVVLFLTLLLFANLCADVKDLRNRENPYPMALLGGESEFNELLQTSKASSPIPLDKIPVRDVGDRKFKADATKVCKNCKWIEEPGRNCAKDNLSLEGITISAVGCQYWALGLTVTEAEPREDGSSVDNSNKNEEET